MHKLMVHLPQGICVLFNEFFVVNDGSSEVADSIVPERLLFFFFFALLFEFELLHQGFKVTLLLFTFEITRSVTSNKKRIMINNKKRRHENKNIIEIISQPLIDFNKTEKKTS